ncbi:endonuclease III [Candidatus Gracilibacteria bacterium]|nr:endonuclease III [Candidatus Gracilibacteria bacterium]
MVKQILAILKELYPRARIELDFGSVFQLVVAVILSAQCTDVRVNKVTPKLFERFPDAEAMAAAPLLEIEKLIFSTGFYRAKAQNIQAMAQMLLADFGGEVPSTMAELLKLPGVARKTANVVLWSGFGKVEGVVVDTHVMRVCGLLGLVSAGAVLKKNAVVVEKELMKVLPRKEWGGFSHLIILHGRRVCVARRPRCGECGLREICVGAKIRD